MGNLQSGGCPFFLKKTGLFPKFGASMGKRVESSHRYLWVLDTKPDFAHVGGYLFNFSRQHRQNVCL